MKKIICWIFGHNAYTYNGGTYETPEQAWACSHCDTELTYGSENWGLNLNFRVTEYISKIGKKDNFNEDDLPF